VIDRTYPIRAQLGFVLSPGFHCRSWGAPCLYRFSTAFYSPPVCLENSRGSDFPHIAQAIAISQPIIVHDKKKLRRSINTKFAHFRLYAMTHGITVNSTPIIQSIFPIRKRLDHSIPSQTMA
jgi:hypothetical protein